MQLSLEDPEPEMEMEEVIVVPTEEHDRLEEEHIPHKKAKKLKKLRMKGYPTEAHNSSEVHYMHPAVVNVNTEGEGYDNGCGYGAHGFGGALLGGALGAGLMGGWGGYGRGYGDYNRGVSVGDMYGAAETNKAAHTVSRDVFAADRDLSHKQMLGDFATLQKIGDSDLKNAIAHMTLARDISETRADLKSDILENRHLSAMEACATREKINESTAAILCKMSNDREQELRDQLLIERTKCNRAEDTIIQNQIIAGLDNLSDLDARITQIVYKIVNGHS